MQLREGTHTMGIFDKKKRDRDDFDSPVEQIDLSAADPTNLAGADFNDSVDDVPPDAAHDADVVVKTITADPPERGRPKRISSLPPGSAYGIDDAIALMRTLPSDNVELVVQVVKHTLESARIDISSIIEDASSKQSRIESRVKVLKDAIAELEREIAGRKSEIATLETDHAETTKVKDRLVLAERLTNKEKDKDTNSEARAAESKPTSAARLARITGEHRAKSPSTPPPPRPSGGTTPPTGAKSSTHTVVSKKS